MAENEKSERDTHFQNAAKLLWDSLLHLNEYGYIDVSDWSDDGIDPTNYRLLIAQFLYGFADHVVEEIQYPNLNTVPDLTQWPTPHQP